ncbi:MAG: hypothetical protein KAR44_00385 [Candidatus Aegiribacteria sp.]|nr:hypothetical protein [Candidatus Aegiribacteria sp.]
MQRYVAVIIIVLIFPSALLAWGFNDAIGNGSPIISVTSKSSAMGGVWSLPSSGAASIFLNPSELSMLDGTLINISTAIIQWSLTVHGVLDYDKYDSGSAGTVTLASGTEISDAVSIAAGITKVSDFRFNGISNILEEIGPGSYQIYAIDILDSHGTLWEANTGISVVLNDWLTAGVSGGIRFGTGSWNLRHDIVDPIALDDTTEVEWEESDFCFHAGVLMPFEFGTFGLSGTNATGRYRSRVAIGFQKEFSIMYGSTLGVEFDIQSIEENNPAVSGKAFANLTEMIPNVRSTYSIGFNRASDYHRAALCLGTGATISFGQVDVDLGVSWMSRSRAGFAFPEPFISNIDDAGTYYSAGLSWKL